VSEHAGHPVDRAESGAGTTTDPTAGFDGNVGTPVTTPMTGQTERAEWIGMPDERPPRLGFFTDTSVCIGCKACEVACKEWNLVPADAGPSGSGPTQMAGLDLLGMSYDNTGDLGANTWRHVAFVESQHRTGPQKGDVRWLMSSDVCKHCTHAACLDVCPTGALLRTEFDTVYVQPDICNGCGYCVPACPYGVIDIRPEDGRAFKCTLCYDRTKDGLTPACAQACPTESIQFGPLDELRERADRRLATLHGQGVPEAQLYGRDPDDGVGGDGAFFLLLDEPETYGLPPDPVVTTRDLPTMWKRAAVAAAGLAAAVAAAFLGSG
jgi:formate dehydrogenase iron-sulfur subunit